MNNDSPPTEGITSDRLRELIETYNLQCFRGDTALALEELERLRHYVATCGGTDNDGRCPMHHLAGVRSPPGARAALNELHQIDQEIFGPAASADFDPLENFAQWCLGASPDDEGMVQHIIDNARGALAHAAEIKARKSPGEPSGKDVIELLVQARPHVDNAGRRYIEQAITRLLDSPSEPSEERQITQLIDERDRNEAYADDLADLIAKITGADIGEHTSSNIPWENAIEAAQEFLLRNSPGEPAGKLDEIAGLANHSIPFYAYGDNQAACEMADLLKKIRRLCCATTKSGGA